MAEGRRLLQELEAAQQAKAQEKKAADDERHERLLGCALSLVCGLLRKCT